MAATSQQERATRFRVLESCTHRPVAHGFEYKAEAEAEAERLRTTNPRTEYEVARYTVSVNGGDA